MRLNISYTSHVCVGWFLPSSDALAQIEGLIFVINAAEMLTSRGVPFSCRGIRDATKIEANAAVIKVLQTAGR